MTLQRSPRLSDYIWTDLVLVLLNIKITRSDGDDNDDSNNNNNNNNSKLLM
jgi:hypothetical protein